MTLANVAWRGGGAIVGATLCTVLALGQSDPSFDRPAPDRPDREVHRQSRLQGLGSHDHRGHDDPGRQLDE